MMRGDLMMAQRAKCERCSVYVSFDPPGLPTCATQILSVRTYLKKSQCQWQQCGSGQREGRQHMEMRQA